MIGLIIDMQILPISSQFLQWVNNAKYDLSALWFRNEAE